MKKTLYCGCAAFVLAVAPCFAAGSTWDGTWKLDIAKSKMTGDTFTIESKANGVMHFSNGSTISYDYTCDGKAYLVIADRTITCTGSPAAGYDYVSKAGNTVLDKWHRSISADGNTLTEHGTEMRADGTTSDFNNVYKRQSGSKGLGGKWMNVKSEGGADSVVIQTKGDWIQFYSPADKVTVKGKMDGSSLPVTGPTIPPGAFESIKPDGPNKMHFAVKYKDKVLDEGTRTLSADGKTFVEEEWVPGKMSEKATLVYDRQ